jgi:hypothetical protein
VNKGRREMRKDALLTPAFLEIGLFQIADEIEELSPFFFKKMNGDIVQFDVIGNFTIWFFSFPGDEILGLCDGGCLGFVIAHGILL